MLPTAAGLRASALLTSLLTQPRSHVLASSYRLTYLLTCVPAHPRTELTCTSPGAQRRHPRVRVEAHRVRHPGGGAGLPTPTHQHGHRTRRPRRGLRPTVTILRRSAFAQHTRLTSSVLSSATSVLCAFATRFHVLVIKRSLNPKMNFQLAPK